MAGSVVTDPESVLRIFAEWTREAEHIVYDIGAYRDNLRWGRADHEPWPESAPALREHSTFVAEWVKERHSLPNESFSRVSDAAERWIAERNADGLPSQGELLLELRVSIAAVLLARFPLIARLSRKGSAPQTVLKSYVHFAIQVRDVCLGLIRDWPAESTERWRFGGVISPRSIPDTSCTPLALALAEARRAGELQVLAPRLEALHAGISDYIQRFIHHPHGNRIIDEPSLLDEATNSLIPFIGADLGDDEEIATPGGKVATPNAERGNGREGAGIEQLGGVVAVRWSQYRKACEAKEADELLDREAYDMVKELAELEGEKGFPSFAAWSRSLSKARQIKGCQKQRPRGKRADSARSVIRQSDA